MGDAKALRFNAFEAAISHFGDAFINRIKSTLDVQLKGRAPITITKGGCIYFYSGLGMPMSLRVRKATLSKGDAGNRVRNARAER